MPSVPDGSYEYHRPHNVNKDTKIYVFICSESIWEMIAVLSGNLVICLLWARRNCLVDDEVGVIGGMQFENGAD